MTLLYIMPVISILCDFKDMYQITEAFSNCLPFHPFSFIDFDKASSQKDAEDMMLQIV